MNKYQLLFIIENDITDEEKQAKIEKFSELISSLGGEIVLIDKWGTRKYAYPIDHKTKGYYVLFKFVAEPTVPAEIDRKMRYDDKIVRQMITRV